MSFGNAALGGFGYGAETKGKAMGWKKIATVAVLATLLGSFESLIGTETGASIDNEFGTHIFDNPIENPEMTKWIYEHIPNEAPWPHFASFANIIVTEVHGAPIQRVATLLTGGLLFAGSIYGAGWWMHRRYKANTGEEI